MGAPQTMALVSGTRFGQYEIADAIGKGGMGEVYRATDTTLERDVAIKVLPESFASDADRIARFEQEAKTLASLNHPNIAQIFGLEKSGGVLALVMELIEGPTLADRIEQGPIPADEALNIAMQIADALEAAHERGIVHRDLKPANVKLKADGTVKVLDFGIAKAFDPLSMSSGTPSPVMTTPVTQAGIILGTAAYMSPEQARGKLVDQRTDIWAFGCVLYEMLTGQPAFGGEDVTITLARVVDRDSDLSSLPNTISAPVRHTIKLCLQKDPRERLHAIGDVRLALNGAFETGAAKTARDGDAGRSIGQRALPIAAAVVLTTLAAGVAAFGLWPRDEPPAVNRFAYSVPGGHRFRRSGRPVLALSPDGRSFVYNADSGLYLRRMGELDAQLIAGTEADLSGPFYSPDGQSVAYFTFDQIGIKRIALSGGAAVVVATGVVNTQGASWGPDNTILFGQPQGIFRVSADGGAPELVIPTRDGEQVYGPELLPDGDSVLFSAMASGPSWDSADIVVESLATGERTLLVAGGSDAHYVPTGHLVYALGANLFAVRFDADALTVSGGAIPLVQGSMRAVNDFTASANYGVSDNGTLVYVSGTTGQFSRALAWVDRDGREEPIDAPPRNYTYAQLSPDGTRIALDIRDQENDIWIWDLERETLQRLTFDPGLNRGPVWSPDSRRIAFSREIDGTEEIWWQAADGSGAAEPLTEGSPMPVMPSDLSRDGTVLLYSYVFEPRDLLMAALDGPATEDTALLASAADEDNPTVSPDGRWLAYESNESGRDEIYVRPFPDVDTGRWQISTDGGTRPLWSRDGRELFYFVGDAGLGAVWAVPVETEPSFRPGTPKLLFEGSYESPQSNRQIYDVSADGQRFLMIKLQGTQADDEPRQIVVVENWLAEVERLVPAR